MSLLLLLALDAQAADHSWSAFDNTAAWEQVATRSSDIGDMPVYLQVIDGLRCLQATADVDKTPGQLFAVATDFPSATRWSSAKLSRSEVLARGDNWYEYLQRLEVPGWTSASDRYWIMRGSRMDQGGTIRLRWDRVPDGSYVELRAEMQADGGAIEPPVNWGEWVFEPRDSGARVYYRLCSDPGGSIPGFVERWAATRTMPDAVVDLVKEARRR